MTVFQHKTQPITITYSEYNRLSASEKQDFMIVNSPQTTNSTTINNQTTDVLGLGEVAGAVVVAPLVIVGSIFGLFD
jgi:hypothetical protein